MLCQKHGGMIPITSSRALQILLHQILLHQTKNYHLRCLGLYQHCSGMAYTGTVLCLDVAHSLKNLL